MDTIDKYINKFQDKSDFAYYTTWLNSEDLSLNVNYYGNEHAYEYIKDKVKKQYENIKLYNIPERNKVRDVDFYIYLLIEKYIYSEGFPSSCISTTFREKFDGEANCLTIERQIDFDFNKKKHSHLVDDPIYISSDYIATPTIIVP